MSTIFAKTNLKKGLVTTICYDGKIYETMITDKFGRRVKTFQERNVEYAKRNHKKCVAMVAN